MSPDIEALSRCVEGMELIKDDKAAVSRTLEYLRSRYAGPVKRQDGHGLRKAVFGDDR